MPRRLACLLLPLLLAACNREEAGPRNVLLIVVDTLRADRLSLYGYQRSTSPNLDAFAREAVTFTNARSPAGCTFPSVNALLTSQPPALFLGRTMGVPETVRSLPEILRGHGYSTAAVSASPIVRNTPSRINAGGGFGRGFQTDLATQRPEEARRLQTVLLRWMETREGPAGDSRRKAEELEMKLRALGYL